MPNWTSVARLLRRRLVLGIIFALSLTYCAISLLSHEKLENSLKRIRVSGSNDHEDTRVDNQDSRIADYNENGDEDAFGGSVKSLDWQLQDNNYETDNDDSIDTARTPIDSNGTVAPPRMCRNSVQGKALIVDERGFVCARSELSPIGCCSTTTLENDKGETADGTFRSVKRKRYSCETCNREGCCAIYEYCVSCCLQPGRRRGKKDGKNIGDKEKREQSKIRRGEDAIKLRLRGLDRFQICLAACRTSSASVRHENTYKDPDSKHCYSRYQRYRPDESLLKNNNDDNSLVVVASFSTLRLLIRSPYRFPIDKYRILFLFLCHSRLLKKKNNKNNGLSNILLFDSTISSASPCRFRRFSNVRSSLINPLVYTRIFKDPASPYKSRYFFERFRALLSLSSNNFLRNHDILFLRGHSDSGHSRLNFTMLIFKKRMFLISFFV